ncbi:hypothetical protein T06_15360 [Trichinella sp. T6]|nr:hypothetical protein T06_15360 [Trichinella sp. T6]
MSHSPINIQTMHRLSVNSQSKKGGLLASTMKGLQFNGSNTQNHKHKRTSVEHTQRAHKKTIKTYRWWRDFQHPHFTLPSQLASHKQPDDSL